VNGLSITSGKGTLCLHHPHQWPFSQFWKGSLCLHHPHQWPFSQFWKGTFACVALINGLSISCGQAACACIIHINGLSISSGKAACACAVLKGSCVNAAIVAALLALRVREDGHAAADELGLFSGRACYWSSQYSLFCSTHEVRICVTVK